MDFKHYSVMLEKSIDYLNIQRNGVYFDGTLGGGGHTSEILKRQSDARVIAVDRDIAAIDNARLHLKQFLDRLQLIHDNFKNISKMEIPMLDGAILDLGVSSYQLDNFDRGFSYRAVDNELDMRMDDRDTVSAFNVVNEYDIKDLLRIFYEFGEEKFSRRIAENIIKNRPIQTCGQLTEIIISSIPAAARRTGGHPAKRIYQAIRIEVNRELEGLDNAVYDIVKKMKPGARLAVLTFHSLEDRIIKHAFKQLEMDCICDKRAPICTCNKIKEVQILTNKPQIACEDELNENKRSQSAKLRVLQKL